MNRESTFASQTPKKIKHKRKKVKMSILKYYKVDSDGKIKRLRRECPSAECGAGIFVCRQHQFRQNFYLLFVSDGLPQGPAILWKMWLDLHLHTW